MKIAIEGIAGAGKSTLRDRILALADQHELRVRHVGQFSWLSPSATRVLVNLRTGRAPVPRPLAIDAARDDLLLHAEHNLRTLHPSEHVLADRLMLSTACMIELAHAGTAHTCLTELAAVKNARPDLTVLVTTPVDLCARRLATRSTSRPLDDPSTAARLRDLYEHCADTWCQLTRTPVRRYTLATNEDSEHAAHELIAELKGNPAG